ncbi:DUF4254 domain-containing protein [Nocardia sp. NPDC050793]|uniref:DUF4254 domain-containing protein n=1 Tax=Nocardia sp. NPDC050793 TaxID=3155159 RepID=UPI0033F9AD5F
MRPPNSTPLPGKDELLAACRGGPARDNLLLAAAGELAELHETGAGREDETVVYLNAARQRWMVVIDGWVSSVLPPTAQSASVHTESMGQVVDRIARLTTYAYVALADGTDLVFQDVRARLAELADGYATLTAELHAGTRRLPAHRGYPEMREFGPRHLFR